MHHDYGSVCTKFSFFPSGRCMMHQGLFCLFVSFLRLFDCECWASKKITCSNDPTSFCSWADASRSAKRRITRTSCSRTCSVFEMLDFSSLRFLNLSRDNFFQILSPRLPPVLAWTAPRSWCGRWWGRGWWSPLRRPLQIVEKIHWTSSQSLWCNRYCR